MSKKYQRKKLEAIKPYETDEIIKMRLDPGPIFKEILQAVLDSKLNGRLKTRNDELGFVKNYVQ